MAFGREQIAQILEGKTGEWLSNLRAKMIEIAEVSISGCQKHAKISDDELLKISARLNKGVKFAPRFRGNYSRILRNYLLWQISIR